MSYLLKEYINAEGKDVNKLRITVYYSLGGVNYATYKQESRGYYLSVTPVNIEDKGYCVCESQTMFTGIKKLIKPVSRQSKKAADEALELAKESRQELIDYVCHQEGVKLINK